MDCLSDSSFEEVVDNAGDKRLIAEFLYMDEGFVCVDNLLEVKFPVRIVGEGSIGIEILVQLYQGRFIRIALEY